MRNGWVLLMVWVVVLVLNLIVWRKLCVIELKIFGRIRENSIILISMVLLIIVG